MDFKRSLHGVMLAALLSVLVYAVLIAVSDFRAVAESIRRVPLWALAGMLALTLGCYSLRALRWSLLVRANGGSVRAADAVWVQMSAMTMTVTPGKIGEVLKAYLGRELHGLPAPKGIALVFVERLMDLTAVIMLSVGGLTVLGHLAPLVVFGVIVVASIAVLSSPRFHRLALRIVERQSWAKAHRHSAEAVAETLGTSLSWRRATGLVGLTAVAWACEGVAFWLCLSALDFSSGLATAIGIYAASTIIGAFTFTPGGIGLTEASMAGLLIAAGMPSHAASAATLLIRVVTLWFGVALGWTALASRPTVLKGLTEAE